MKNLRERWRGLAALGVAVFAAACMTVAPAPSFADIAGGGGGGGPITERCPDGRPISYWEYNGWNGTKYERRLALLRGIASSAMPGGLLIEIF